MQQSRIPKLLFISTINAAVNSLQLRTIPELFIAVEINDKLQSGFDSMQRKRGIIVYKFYL
jgi:hypothetical protein